MGCLREEMWPGGRAIAKARQKPKKKKGFDMAGQVGGPLQRPGGRAIAKARWAGHCKGPPWAGNLPVFAGRNVAGWAGHCKGPPKTKKKKGFDMAGQVGGPLQRPG